MKKLKDIIKSVVTEVRLKSQKNFLALGNISDKEFNEMTDDNNDSEYYFSNDYEGNLWGLMYGFVLSKLNNRQITNILDIPYRLGDDVDDNKKIYATDKIMDSYDNFKYMVDFLNIGDIQISNNNDNIQEIRLKQGGTEKQDKIVSYEETGGPHDFYRYWKDDSHNDDILYYTMSDQSTWDDEQEEKFEVYKSTENGFTMIFTNLDEKDAIQLAYKQAMDDPNGKFVKWNMSYSRIGLTI